MTYTQCTLTRGFRTTVAWIPTRYAKLDNALTINDCTWVVTELGTRLSERFVHSHRDDYRYQRGASDI